MHRIAYLAAVPLLTPVLLLVVTSAGADPPPGARWVPIPALTDEFEAEVLDGRKWTDHNPNWKGRKPGYFSPANVRVHDGKLHLTAKAEDLPDLPEGYHTFTTAAVRSIADVRYGYFEIKCRPMRSRASSAFWFYKTEPDTWTEIDVFEIGGGAPDNERIYHMNAHVFRTPEYKGTVEKHLTHPGFWKAPYDLAAEYHVYGLEWDEEEIAWYVDGKRVRTLPNQYWHQPLYMNFDSETMPDWFGLPENDKLPAAFSIEYVRSWKMVGAGEAEAAGEAQPGQEAEE